MGGLRYADHPTSLDTRHQNVSDFISNFDTAAPSSVEKVHSG